MDLVIYTPGRLDVRRFDPRGLIVPREAGSVHKENSDAHYTVVSFQWNNCSITHGYWLQRLHGICWVVWCLLSKCSNNTGEGGLRLTLHNPWTFNARVESGCLHLSIDIQTLAIGVYSVTQWYSGFAELCVTPFEWGVICFTERGETRWGNCSDHQASLPILLFTLLFSPLILFAFRDIYLLLVKLRICARVSLLKGIWSRQVVPNGEAS